MLEYFANDAVQFEAVFEPKSLFCVLSVHPSISRSVSSFFHHFFKFNCFSQRIHSLILKWKLWLNGFRFNFIAVSALVVDVVVVAFSLFATVPIK